MGLFDKKFCDICGEKIGLLGNRKLEDGNMCKDCAKLLSPLFSDRRSSTLEEIKQQLAYREENKGKLAAFRSSLNFGDSRKIYIDTANGNFVISSSKPGSWSDENPDVQALSSIQNCGLRVEEDKDEIYTQGKDGQRVSYTPPRYKFYYDFYLDFNVNNPYFDDFSVKLNSFRVEGMGSMEYNKYQQMAVEAMNYLVPGRCVVPNMGNAGMGAATMGMGGVPQQGYAPYGQQPVQGGYAPQPNMYQQPVQNGYAPQQGFAPQQNPYGQQPVQGGYAPQPNMYQQPQQGYAPQQGFAPQQNPYGQQPQQGFAPQQNAMQGWVCQYCGATNGGGNFCQSCGAQKA
ncbi:MAG: DUF4428 domain-containing protein [Clostridia bacterium]|nr:DUF4428 domain-containing protein [Clostridia bacterium]